MTRLIRAKLLIAFLALALVAPLLAGCEAHGNVDDHDFNVNVRDNDRHHDGDRNRNHDDDNKNK